MCFAVSRKSLKTLALFLNFAVFHRTLTAKHTPAGLFLRRSTHGWACFYAQAHGIYGEAHPIYAQAHACGIATRPAIGGNRLNTSGEPFPAPATQPISIAAT